MSKQNTTHFYSMLYTDLHKEIKTYSGKPSKRFKWIEQNFPKLLKSDFNQENYHNALQGITILSKIECEAYKEDARNIYKDFIKNGVYSQYIKFYNDFLNKLDLYKPNPAIDSLPKYSFFIQFKFSLRKPFYSHDDEDFYTIDNPVTKEHIFKLPMMRPSGWKGNLRSAVITINNLPVECDNNPLVKKLFGCIEKNGKKQNKGRLIFYPTYFDKIGLEIINPHDRKTKAGTNPILFEVVPEGSSGIFSLLYIPFDRIGSDDADRKNEGIADFREISQAIKEMMTIYGFGAKTSSGFGVTKDKIENCVVGINGINPPKSKISTFDELNMIVGGL